MRAEPAEGSEERRDEPQDGGEADPLPALLRAGRGRAAAERISDDVEESLTQAFDEALPAGARVAVLATGGLARRELTPAADVDLWVLVPDEPQEGAILSAVQDALRALWDRGLSLGHSVRTPAEAEQIAREDQVAATALLEARPVAGDLEHGRRLLTDLHRRVIAPRRRRLLEEKVSELLARRQRFGGAVHLVEPNVKSSPGGLRDIHSLLWIGLLASPWRREDIGAGRDAFHHLLETGRLTKEEVTAMREAADVLLSVRIALHRAARRREDRLIIEHQAAIAEALGVGPEGDATPAEGVMHRVVRASRQVRYALDSGLSRMLEGNALRRWERASRVGAMPAPPGPRLLERGFRARGPSLYIDDPAAFDADPARVVDLFRLAAEHDLSPTARTLSRARMAIEGRGDLYDDPGVGAALLRLCRSTSVIGHPFMALLETGLAGPLLRDLDRLEARFKHDGYHAYTTDAHICRCADLALQVVSGAAGVPPPLMPSYRRTSRFHLLVLGALFHDIAKGLGGDHSQQGVDVACREGERMGLPPAEIDLLAFLVEEHLLLSRVSQRRDISDPAVIEEVAAKVRTVERLDLLGLLTFVDIASVAPGMFTDWKARLLGMAVERTAAHLRDPAAARVRTLEEEAVQRAARSKLEGLAPAEVLDRFLDGASVRSLSARFTKSLERDLQTYAAFVAPPAGEKAPAAVVNSKVTEGGRAHTLRVACRDRAGLLAELASTLAAQGANVLHAHADMRDDGVAVCAFRIDDRGTAMDPTALRLTEDAVRAVAAGEEPAPEPRAGRAPRGPPIPAVVRVVDGVDSWGAAIIEVRGADRTGLLANLFHVIAEHGLQVNLAKVSTEGSRVRDTFFLTDEDNQPPERDALYRLAQALSAVVEVG